MNANVDPYLAETFRATDLELDFAQAHSEDFVMGIEIGKRVTSPEMGASGIVGVTIAAENASALASEIAIAKCGNNWEKHMAIILGSRAAAQKIALSGVRR